jgi:murein DD-endopeptidase MepM/ murein hydrolase activator NlpD
MAAARRAQRQATEARIAVRRATARLLDARKQEAHAKAVVADIAQLMYTNPAGGALVTDPQSAPLVSSFNVDSPESYVEQSQQLATLASSLSTRVEQAAATLQLLETTEQLAIERQAVARSTAVKARHTKNIALHAQHQAKQVFLRLSGEGRTSSEEAWWITQFASSDLGQMLAGLHGGPHFDMHFVVPNSGEITSPYGMRMHPILHEYRLHTGTDFAGGDGRIHAAADGTVVRAGYDVAYGNYIVIYHGQYNGRSVATLYAHSAALYVHSGQKVQAGDVIGLIGSTGYATGPHLHFEVRLAGRPVDPELFLP